MNQLTPVICCHLAGNEKLQSSYVGIFCVKKRNPRNLKTRQLGFDGTRVISVVHPTLPTLTLTIFGREIWSFTHRKKKHPSKKCRCEKAQVSIVTPGVLCCVVVLFRWWDFFLTSKNERNTKNGHVIHVPVWRRYGFFQMSWNHHLNVTRSLGFV